MTDCPETRACGGKTIACIHRGGHAEPHEGHAPGGRLNWWAPRAGRHFRCTDPHCVCPPAGTREWECACQESDG